MKASLPVLNGILNTFGSGPNDGEPLKLLWLKRLIRFDSEQVRICGDQLSGSAKVVRQRECELFHSPAQIEESGGADWENMIRQNRLLQNPAGAALVVIRSQ
jgi:hypothetical protein